MINKLSRFKSRVRGSRWTQVGGRSWLPVSIAAVAATAAVLGGDFPIADQGVAMSASFDGGHYLVGVENHLTTPPTIGAQLISTNGAKVGSLIPTGRTGIATALAYDGARHLLIWEDDELGALNGSTGWKVYGQFIGREGALSGSPFAITTAGIWFDGIKTLAFGGGRYLVTYTRLINPALGGDSNNRYIAGRMVQPDGTLGEEFRISTGYGKASDVAFDGSNFLVVWCEDALDREIRGRLVSPAGVPGVEFRVNSGLAPSDNPKSVAFDGTHYLVVWNEEVEGQDTGTWDAFGQLVSTNGALVGGRITITSEAGPQMITTVSFDGSHHLAVWSDMSSETNWNLHARFVDRAGSLVGGKLTLSAGEGNELGGAIAVAGRHMILVNHGVELGEGGIAGVDFATGLFLEPPLPPQIVTGDGVVGVQDGHFGFAPTGPAGATVVIEASSSLVPGSWSPVATNVLSGGSSKFVDPQPLSPLGRFYRLRMQ